MLPLNSYTVRRQPHRPWPPCIVVLRPFTACQGSSGTQGHGRVGERKVRKQRGALRNHHRSERAGQHPAATALPPSPRVAPWATPIRHVVTSLYATWHWSMRSGTKSDLRWQGRHRPARLLAPALEAPRYPARPPSMSAKTLTSPAADCCADPDKRYAFDLTPNPSLQRTLPGRSPGQRR